MYVIYMYVAFAQKVGKASISITLEFYYEVATISRLLKIMGLILQNMVSFIGLFCKRDL